MKGKYKLWILGISVLIVVLISLLLITLGKNGSLSSTSESEIKLCEDSTCFYRLGSDECVCPTVTNLGCEEPYTLDQPENQVECNSVGGVWDECPQCPKGRVCSSSVCEATCSVGQKCVWDNVETKSLCYDDEDINRDGTCYVFGDKVEPLYQDENSLSCPSGSESTKGLGSCRIVLDILQVCPDAKINRETGLCELPYDKSEVCADLSEPTFDVITLNDKCFNDNFRVTELQGDVYDSNFNKLVDASSINVDEIKYSQESPVQPLYILLGALLGFCVILLIMLNGKKK